MSTEIIKWITDNVFKDGRLAVILVLLFIALYVGIVPSPMLSAVEGQSKEHRGLELILRQICVNTARTPTQLSGCFYPVRDP